ncbi:DUF924 family protein [Psychrobacter urativorans]|uniref:DUF924 domain-containing protein n=1 Tax=Psychrobacter urativorans TaxID=45610 RepID=A0A0M4TD28_9GAMM|nr:DUF924 family protein [Psychrobacter urativorans]ALF58629.1 hypothetical protein AOC03_00035 [Psychrobacter urativorans]
MTLSTDNSILQSQHQPQPDVTKLNAEALAVLEFWFAKDNQPYWFVVDKAFDKQIKDKFGKIWQTAIQGQCAHWRRTEQQTINQADDDTEILIINLAGRLAEIIVLDQFSRNLCRGQACAFAQDKMSLVLAQEAICQPNFAALPMPWRKFMIMPFMHSESAVIHEKYLPLFKQLNDPLTLDFAYKHQAIIEKFGRYPHRNAALNRVSTAAELAFLQQPNSSF